MLSQKYYEANVYSAVETFELERKHVTRVKELGHGAFGEVFLAKVKLNSGRTMECAVKQLKEVRRASEAMPCCDGSVVRAMLYCRYRMCSSCVVRRHAGVGSL